MKLSTLLESYADEQLVQLARQAGEGLYGKRLIFHDTITKVTWEEYEAQGGDDIDEASVDTFSYVFYPSTGKGVESADLPLKKKHIDKDGNIYFAGSMGVYVITNPKPKS